MASQKQSDSGTLVEASTPGGDGAPADADADADRAAGWRYVVTGEHARGGLGRVLIARDLRLDRVVAIKELLGEGEERFRREAHITARLEHPAVVPVHDAGTRPSSGAPFYAMKLIAGRPLAEAMAAARGLDERLALLPNLLAVCEAVAYAHSRRIVHRDLKPQNVIVGEYGETVVIDWGLAKELDAPAEAPPSAVATGAGEARATDSEEALTVVGSVLGTPAYMAPEQARGEAVDARADVYALGAMLYHLLAGRPPYAGAGAREVLEQVRHATPEPLAQLSPVADDLAAVVAKAMAREPSRRYPNAGELAADLRRFRDGQLVAAHRYSVAERLARLARRHRGVAAAAALFSLAALAGGGVFLVREQRLRHHAEAASARAELERGRAERERERAERQTVALLEEHGRLELAAGRPSRAAVYLVEALRRDPERPALRWLVSEAIAPLEALERRLDGHSRDVIALRFTPDGRRAVSASSDGTARLWDVDSGRTVAVLGGHTAPLNDAAVSHDGQLVATGAGDRSVRLYRVADGAFVRAVADPDPYRIAFLPGGELVIGGHEGDVRVIDARGGPPRLLAQPHGRDRVQAIAVSPDGARFVTGGWDQQVIIWDARTLAPIARLSDQDSDLSGARYSPDGSWLITTGADGPVLLREAATGRVVRRVAMPPGARWSHAWVTPDGQRLVTTSIDGGVRVMRLAGGEPLFVLDAEAGGKLLSAALDGSGERLLTAGVGGVIHLWRPRDGSRYRLLAPASPGAPSATPAHWADGGRLMVTATEMLEGVDGEVQIRSADDGSVVKRFSFPHDPWITAFDPALTRMIFAGETNPSEWGAMLWDVEAGRILARVSGGKGRVYSVAGSRDGARFATAGGDGTARLWDARTGAPVGPVLRHEGRVAAVAFDPTGTLLATTTEKGLLSLWELASQRRLWEVAASPTWIQAVAFSADGRKLVTAGRQDHTAHVWDAADGRQLLSLAGHDDNLFNAGFSADGRVIATVSVDGVALLWDAESGELLRRYRGPAFGAAISPDGLTLLATGEQGYLVAWDLRLDAREPAALLAWLETRSPWRLVDGRLGLRE